MEVLNPISFKLLFQDRSLPESGPMRACQLKDLALLTQDGRAYRSSSRRALFFRQPRRWEEIKSHLRRKMHEIIKTLMLMRAEGEVLMAVLGSMPF